MFSDRTDKTRLLTLGVPVPVTCYGHWYSPNRYIGPCSDSVKPCVGHLEARSI